MPNKQYDYVIIGAGLFGSIFAYEAKKRNKKCLVIDRRNHIGGNTYCEKIGEINVHKYGAHIFHTNNISIWRYVKKLAKFNRFTNSPLASYKGKLYNLPFNMNTFYQVWGITDPIDAEKKINEQIKASGYSNPSNLEEQALSLVGVDLYNMFIKGYTEKQWGRKAKDLPAFIIKRLPIRFTFDNNYFNDRYQGIPEGGYNTITEILLSGIEIKLGVEYFLEKYEIDNLAKKIVFTGNIDQFFDYKFGELEYRSLKFNNETLNISNYQGNAVINFTEFNVPYTRIIEHKHFEFGKQKNTVITKEYPATWKKGMEPYYPINDDKNNVIYEKYCALSKQYNNVIFGGRLAEYKYYDMHQVIGSALKAIDLEFN